MSYLLVKSILITVEKTLSKERRGKMNISIKISENITEEIQILDTSQVNFSADLVLTGLIILSVVLILGVNSSIIKWVVKKIL